MAAKRITDEARKKYLEVDSRSCPFCGSDQIEGGSYDSEGSCIYQKIGCLECEESWYDQYELKDDQYELKDVHDGD